MVYDIDRKSWNPQKRRGIPVLYWIIIAFLALVYLALPLWARIFTFILNLFLPDPIPYADEIFMIAGIFSKMILFENFMEFYEENKGLVWVAVILLFIMFLIVIF